MLRELVEKKHTVFADKARDWRDAIRLSCAPFAADGTAEEGYADEVIRCIEQYGPYIVILPGVSCDAAFSGKWTVGAWDRRQLYEACRTGVL